MAMGYATSVTANHGVAIGTGSAVAADGGVALGVGSRVEGATAIALGAGSLADRDDAVSVGSAGNARPVPNVPAATQDTAAANMAQQQDLDKAADNTTYFSTATTHPHTPTT